MTEWRWIDVFARQLRALRAQPRRAGGGALGVGQPPRARRDRAHRSADAGRARLRRRRAHACEHRARGLALDRRIGRAGRQSGRDRRPRRSGPRARLHRRGSAARARARRDPRRRGARAHDQQRAPRELRALRRRPVARAAGRARRGPARGGRGDARDVGCGHRSHGQARGRLPRRLLGRRRPTRARSRTGRAGCAWRSPPRTASRAPSCSRPETSTSPSRRTSASR